MYRPVERRHIQSDGHVGLWQKRNTHTLKEREDAAHVFVEHANNLDSRIILNGDTVDLDRSEKSTIEEEALLYRGALQKALRPPLVIKGNHDEELKRDDAEELLGPHEFHRGEIYVDHEAHAVFTHGHIFDNEKTRKRIRRLAATGTPYSREAVINHICDTNILPKELKETADYNASLEAAERLHSLITTVGETIVSMVGKHRKWFRNLMEFNWDPRRLKNKHLKDFLEYIDEWMCPSELSVAQMTNLLGATATAIGHTHIQSVSIQHAWQHKHQGDHARILTGNGGSLVQTGQDLTWLMLETDHVNQKQQMSLYRYNKARKEPEVMQQKELIFNTAL